MMQSWEPVFPSHIPIDANGNGGQDFFGITTHQYIALEMTKALIGRMDSVIFNKTDLIDEAIVLTNIFMQKVP